MDKRLTFKRRNLIFLLLLFNFYALAESEASFIYNPETGLYENLNALQNNEILPSSDLEIDSNAPQQNTVLPISKAGIEVNTNFTFSKLDYNIITSADSILKWRDSSGLGVDFSIAKVTDFGNKFIFSYQNTKLSGGTMSDYDMENCYPQCGIFSEATQMSGFSQNYSIGYESLKYSGSEKDVSWLFGYEYRTLELNPSNIYQVVYDPSGLTTNTHTAQTGVGHSSKQSQNTKVVMHGIQLGAIYKKKFSNSNNLIFSGELFLPLSFESKQYNWGYGNSSGYDWKLENSGIAGYGLRGKIQNQVRLSSATWWNIYTFADMTSIDSSMHANRISGVEKNNGVSKDIKIYRFGIGTGLTFN